MTTEHPRVCKKCEKRARVFGELYCKDCKKSVLGHLRRSGFLTPAPMFYGDKRTTEMKQSMDKNESKWTENGVRALEECR